MEAPLTDTTVTTQAPLVAQSWDPSPQAQVAGAPAPTALPIPCSITCSKCGTTLTNTDVTIQDRFAFHDAARRKGWKIQLPVPGPEYRLCPTDAPTNAPQ